MTGASWIDCQITTNVYSCLNTGGGSTFPLAHLTPLSPIMYRRCFVSWERFGNLTGLWSANKHHIEGSTNLLICYYRYRLNSRYPFCNFIITQKYNISGTPVTLDRLKQGYPLFCLWPKIFDSPTSNQSTKWWRNWIETIHLAPHPPYQCYFNIQYLKGSVWWY